MTWSPAQLREARARLGVSQEVIGGLVGASAQTVGRWERAEYTPSRHQRACLDLVFEASARDDARAVGAEMARAAKRHPLAGFEPVLRTVFAREVTPCRSV